jgi:hypothetical protein
MTNMERQWEQGSPGGNQFPLVSGWFLREGFENLQGLSARTKSEWVAAVHLGLPLEGLLTFVL